MSNLFTARFDLNSATLVNLTVDTYDIDGTVVDNTGIFYATDVAVGDIIYNDQQSMNMGVGRYRVLSIDSSTSGANLIARVQWDIIGQDPQDPVPGFGATIGKDAFGATALPSINTDTVDESLITAIRNVEGMNMASYSYSNRNQGVVMTGLVDGTNTVFSISGAYIASTVVVYYNGIKLTKGVSADYVLTGVDRVTLNFAPKAGQITIDYNSLV